MSLMSLLQQATSPQERFQMLSGILDLIAPQNSSTGFSSPGTAPVGGAPAPSGPPTMHLPEGQTEYAYETYPKPYTGVPKDLVTRHGLTLQRGPMRSLVDLFRGPESVLPGLRELNQAGQGYRSYEQQVAAQGNPYAADPGESYHQQGLAVDFGWINQYPDLVQALYEAGWNQFNRGYEPWHFSYGVVG